MRRLSAFTILNGLGLSFIAFLCLLPFINILAVSFSSSAAATQGLVKLWPVDFTFSSYNFVIQRIDFWKSMFVSLERIFLAVPLSMILTIMAAYPLSKEAKVFKSRTVYAWFFFLTMIFNGGLIPSYMVVKQTGLIDSILALVIPISVSAFNIMLLLNFFRQLPKELEEAALIDGAHQWIILWKIYVPISLPALATIVVLTSVTHWNAWFDGLIYMNKPEHYPMQSFLRTVITMPDLTYLTSEEFAQMHDISDRTVKSAQIFIAALPIMAVYPMLQKYFVKGMVLGSVKG